ncbi:MAG: CaiB/BaiF CoA-transferase family protein [Pseudomonadota bacterium]
MGPLAGLRVLEFEAIGAAPFAGMLLADMGADVLLVDRVSAPGLGLESPRWSELMLRGRRSVTLDLKSPSGVQAAMELAARAEAVIEGFRPGVMERLGLGPDLLLARNPKLVVGRMSGWGQTGPLAPRAGHDINYIALAGVLGAIGRAGEAPVPPLNLVGDFGGGMLLAFGVACGVIEARGSGRGQVIDAAMIDAASTMSTMFAGLRAAGQWRDERGVNVIDSGAPWYDSYPTRDGKHVAVGAIESKFYAALIERLGLADAGLPGQHERARWPELRARFAAVFLSRTRDEWCAHFDGVDACFAPVLDFAEAQAHPHNQARGRDVGVDGIVQPAPAPRFERTPGAVRHGPPERGAMGREALSDWGFGPTEVDRLAALGLGFLD